MSTAQIALEIRFDGDDVVLNGVKRPVEVRRTRRSQLLVSRTHRFDGLTQVLVSRGDGWRLDLPDADGRPDQLAASPTVTFDDVRVPRRRRGRRDREGRRGQVERQLQLALVM